MNSIARRSTSTASNLQPFAMTEVYGYVNPGAVLGQQTKHGANIDSRPLAPRNHAADVGRD